MCFSSPRVGHRPILRGGLALLLVTACTEEDTTSENTSSSLSDTANSASSTASHTGSATDSDSSSSDHTPSGPILPPLPEAINAFGVTAVGPSIYIFGGNVGAPHDESIASVRRDFRRLAALDLAPGWSSLQVDGEAVQQPTLTTWHDQVIRVGGLTARNRPGEAKSLHTLAVAARFDPATSAWHDLPPLPGSRASHSATVVGQHLAVIGGWSLEGPAESGVYATTWYLLDLDPNGMSWQEFPQPFTLRDHCAATIDGQIYVLGGMLSGTFPLTPWILDPATQAWTRGPDLPAKTPIGGFGCAAATIGDRLFVTLAEGLIYELNAARDGWATVGSLHTPRAFHGLVAVDPHTLVALGGGIGQNLQPSADVETVWIP